MTEHLSTPTEIEIPEMSELSKVLDIPVVPELPEAIIKAAVEKKLILFIGAGLSSTCGLTLWSDLKEELIREFKPNHSFKNDLEETKKELMLSNDYYYCFSVIKNYDSPTYERIMKKALKPSAEAVKNFKEIFPLIKDLNPLSVVTLNVDPLLRDYGEFDKIYLPPRCYSWQIQQNSLFCFHGLVDVYGEDSLGLVFTNGEQAQRYSEQDSQKFLHNIFGGNYTILFIGFSFSDYELLKYAELPRIIHDEFQEKNYYPHYALLHDSHGKNTLLTRYGIKPLTYALKGKSHENFTETFKSWSRKLKGPTEDQLLVEDTPARIPSR